MAVDPELKDRIQAAYSNYLKGRDIQSRMGQRQMIGAIANYLSDIQCNGDGKRTSPAQVCVIEAGTGTGKTLAYLVGTLPFAHALNKKIVIATATVTLQQQILERELPLFREHSGLEFSAALAKGRGRYLCLHKLDLHLQSSEGGSPDLFYDQTQKQVPLPEPGEDGASGQTAYAAADYQKLLDRITQSGWAGDVDSLPEPVEEGLWRSVTVDHRQCLNRSCAYIQQCPYFRAKADQDQAEVIVANHDLLLADLALGGGIVLPPPEECIYLFDEAHHLPEKTIQHFSAQAGMASTRTTLNSLSRLAVELQSLSYYDATVVNLAQDLTPHIQTVHEGLTRLQAFLRSEIDWKEDGENQGFTKRFEQGILPDALKTLMADVQPSVLRVGDRYDKLIDRVKSLSENRDSGLGQDARWQRSQVALAAISRPLEGIQSLWQAMTRQAENDGRPNARWIQTPDASHTEDARLFVSPTDAAGYLQAKLWDRAFAAILTSATLSIGGDFRYFTGRAGLPEESVSRSFPSPFDYAGQGVLQLLDMGVDPSDTRDYYDRLAEVLAQHINSQEGTLVLFSARKHLREVARRLADKRPEWNLLVQDSSNRAQIIQQHRDDRGEGKGSCLMGLASFAEGLDLPGHLLTHVIITRLPFSVPDEPVEATLSEWLKSKGRNPFVEVSLPAASIRLVQACGRLLRHEEDRGTITLLDRRLWTKHYGGQMLNSLPPFRRTFVRL